MKKLIIALLFRITLKQETLLEKIEFVTYVTGLLLANPDFSDTDSQTLLGKLADAVDKAFKAHKQAESRATADIKARDAAAKKMEKAYKKVVLRTEEICDDDEDKAGRTGLPLRLKKSKKNPVRPEKLVSKAGKQDGEINARCKSLGDGFTYLWYIRKETETNFGKPTATQKASITFTGLEPGVKYVICVASKTSDDEISEVSATSTCRAKLI